MNGFISQMSPQFSEKTVNQGFLRNIDLFGVGINIKFNEKEKHKTKLGGFITLLMISLLVIYSINLFQQIIYKNRPQVFYQQEAVEMPMRYDITANNFSMAIALLDDHNQPYLDEQIYSLVADLYFKVQKVNSLGQIEDKFERKLLNVVPCREDHFQDPQTQNYFYKLKYSQMHCIDMTEQLYLVGQFDTQQFSRITFYLKECIQNQTNNCKDPTLVKKAIASSTLQIYYTNRLLNLQNREEPFKRVGQTQFWTANYDQLQNISLMYMNNHIIDDVGFLYEELQEKVDLLFSSDRVLYTSRFDSTFYIIKIFLEKNKENYYRRTYLRFNQAISQLGGYFNVLFALGCLLSQPYAKLQLHKFLINQTFSFSKKNFNDYIQRKKPKPDLKIPKSPINQENQTQLRIEPTVNLSGLQKPVPQLKLSNNISQVNQQENYQQKKQTILSQLTSASPNQPKLSYNKSNEEQNPQSELRIKSDSQDEPQQQQKIAVSSYFQELKQNAYDFLYSYFHCLKSEDSEEQQILNFCMSKIYQYTDICFIVNKLIELEKLKSLLLDSDQIKIFEYIPKPKVNKTLLKKLQVLDKLHKNYQQEKGTINNNNQDDMIDLSFENQNENQIVNILTIQNRSMSQKIVQAQNAFQKIISKKENQSRLDKRLISLIGKTMKNKLDESTFYLSKRQLPFSAKKKEINSNNILLQQQLKAWKENIALQQFDIMSINSQDVPIEYQEKDQQISNEIEDIQFSPRQNIYNSLLIQQFPHIDQGAQAKQKTDVISQEYLQFPQTAIQSQQKINLNNEKYNDDIEERNDQN